MTPAPAPDPQSAWQIFISLIPVITGGLIGIIGGLSGSAFGRFLQSKEEKKALKRAKLETLVSHLFELDHWANKLRDHYLFETTDQPYETNPTSKIKALTSIYFPTLHDRATQLDSNADHYQLALMELRKAMLLASQQTFTEKAAQLTAENPANPHLVDLAKLAGESAKTALLAGTPPYAAQFKTLMTTRKTLLTETRTFAESL